MQSITVRFESGNSINTQINGTPDEIRAYYVGNYFNLGVGDADRMERAISVEFHPA